MWTPYHENQLYFLTVCYRYESRNITGRKNQDYVFYNLSTSTLSTLRKEAYGVIRLHHPVTHSCFVLHCPPVGGASLFLPYNIKIF